MNVPVGPKKGYAPAGVTYGHKVLPATKPGATAARTREDPILTLVKQILSLQQAPLNAAERERQATVAQTQQNMQNSTAALVAELQKGAGNAAGVYDQAIGQTNALASNAAALLKGANPDAANQALLSAVGAPAAQHAQVGAQNQAGFGNQAGVLYEQGGAIPGASLAAQKAAAVTQLAGLPTIAALNAAGQTRGLLAQSGQAHQSYLQDLMRVGAQAPQLVQQYRAQRQAEAAAAERAKISAAGQLQNAQYLAFQEGLKGKQFELAVQKQTAAYDLAAANAKIAAQRAGTYQQSVDQTGAYHDATVKNAAAKTAAAAGAKATKARATAVKNRGNARVAALNKALGIPTKTTQTVSKPGKFGGTVQTTVKTNRPYKAIHKQAMALPQVQLLWTRYGYTRAQVAKLVDQALAGKGIKKPPGPRKKQPVTPLNPLGT